MQTETYAKYHIRTITVRPYCAGDILWKWKECEKNEEVLGSRHHTIYIYKLYWDFAIYLDHGPGQNKSSTNSRCYMHWKELYKMNQSIDSLSFMLLIVLTWMSTGKIHFWNSTHIQRIWCAYVSSYCGHIVRLFLHCGESFQIKFTLNRFNFERENQYALFWPH